MKSGDGGERHAVKSRRRAAPPFVLLAGLGTVLLSLTRVLDDGSARDVVRVLGFVVLGIALVWSLGVMVQGLVERRQDNQEDDPVPDEKKPFWDVPEGSFKPRNLLLGAAIPVVAVGLTALLLLLL